MSCPRSAAPHCLLLEALDEAPPVTAASGGGGALVEYEPGRVRPEQLAEAVARPGYTTRVTAAQER